MTTANQSNKASAIKILAAESDKLNRFLLEKLCALKGYQVDTVEDSQALLKQLSGAYRQYDVVIMNICEPTLKELTVVKTIRSLTDKSISSIPILVTTGFVDPEVTQKCQQEGIAEVLLKPYMVEAFADKVEEWAFKHREISWNELHKN